MGKKERKRSTRMCATLLAIAATIIMAPVLTVAGDLEPTAPPATTMLPLDELPPSWSQKLPCDTAENCPRFKLVLPVLVFTPEGYVTVYEGVLDKETGLVWAKNANLFGVEGWVDAQGFSYRATIGNRKGWRLPKIDELTSLVDPTRSNPPLPSGHPFINVQSDTYWANSYWECNSESAYTVLMTEGNVNVHGKNNHYYVWPVRGGK